MPWFCFPYFKCGGRGKTAKSWDFNFSPKIGGRKWLSVRWWNPPDVTNPSQFYWQSNILLEFLKQNLLLQTEIFDWWQSWTYLFSWGSLAYFYLIYHLLKFSTITFPFFCLNSKHSVMWQKGFLYLCFRIRNTWHY